jgi:hypothetical protein
MRDFRDAKAMARTLRQALAAKGVKLTNSEALELVARQLGARDWNTLAAEIAAAETPEPVAAAPPAPLPPALARDERTTRTGQRFSSGLEATLHRAVGLANGRKHQYAALEHLLVAALDDPDAFAVLEACAVDVGALRVQATAFIDNELTSIVDEDGGDCVPTAGFHRVIQRSVIHVRSSGRDQVTGANVLVAIFSERESHACASLEQQGMTRLDAVNFIAHGIRKDGGGAT